MICIQNRIHTFGCRIVGGGCKQREHASKLLNESMQNFIIVLISEVVKEDNNDGILKITYYLIDGLMIIFVYENMIQNPSGIFLKTHLHFDNRG